MQIVNIFNVILKSLISVEPFSILRLYFFIDGTFRLTLTIFVAIFKLIYELRNDMHFLILLKKYNDLI